MDGSVKVRFVTHDDMRESPRSMRVKEKKRVDTYPNWKQQGKEPQEKEPSERVRLEMALMVRDD